MSLKRNFSWLMGGNLVYAGCQWLALIAIAKLGAPDIVGEFAFALALTSPIVIFYNLNMRAFQATDARNEFCFADYLLSRLVQVVLALTTIAVIVCFLGYAYAIATIVVGVSLYKAIESISDIYYGRLQKCEDMGRIGVSLMIRGAIFVAAISASMRITDDVVLGVFLTATGWLAVLLLHDRRRTSVSVQSSIHSSMSRVWLLSKKCFPLGVVTFLISLNANIPSYVIKAYLDTTQLGIFSALVYFAIVGQFVSGALAQAAAPRLARHYSRAEWGQFRSLQLRLMTIGVGMAVLGVLFVVLLGQYVLEIFYGAEYANRVDVFLWVIVSAGIGYVAIFLGTGLTVARRFREMVLLNVSAVIATLALSLALIPSYGLIGAGWALTGSAALKFTVNLIVNYSIIRRSER